MSLRKQRLLSRLQGRDGGAGEARHRAVAGAAPAAAATAAAAGQGEEGVEMGARQQPQDQVGAMGGPGSQEDAEDELRFPEVKVELPPLPDIPTEGLSPEELQVSAVECVSRP